MLMAQNQEVNNDLVRFFKKWRAFEKPPLKNGVPDYSSVAFKDRSSKYRQLREELNKLYVKDMLVEHKVDWYLLWAMRMYTISLDLGVLSYSPACINISSTAVARPSFLESKILYNKAFSRIGFW